MKYKGKEIGNPSIRQIKDCLEYLRLPKNKFSPEKIYAEFSKRRWFSLSGKPISNLENCIRGICSSNSWRYFTEEYELSVREKKRKHREAKLQPKLMQIASDKTTPYSPYNEQLKDSRWKAFREFIFDVRGRKCEMCGETKRLQVHHPKYISGRKAWEYTCNDVVVLCEQCHRKAHGLLY